MKAAHKILDVARLGLASLTIHKVRSSMAALGIIFGVFGVIAMLVINEGASREAQQALREMGSDNIIIRSVKPPQSSGAAEQLRGAVVYGLTRTDVARLRDNIPGVERSASAHLSTKYARAGINRLQVTVVGTEPSFAAVARMELRGGRFLTDEDLLRRSAHCVLTSGLADALFGFAEPLGAVVRLDGHPFVVVGVLGRVPAALDLAGSDAVMIPLTTERSRYGEYSISRAKGAQSSEKVEVSHLVLRMADERGVETAAAASRELLDRHHDKRDWDIKVPLELLEQQEKQARLWKIVFLVIASVSMLVGGIGIVNIMLASVTERTREIGIRRALGARRADIVVQFLVEAVTLTTVGGLVGIGAGLAVPKVIGKVLELNVSGISPATLLVPFLMAVVVGLVSGIYPAYRAAMLDPIHALRHE